MAVAASVLIARARDVLIDSGGTRWPEAEMLRWLSDGQRAIVIAIPAATATRATHQLVAGTLQTIPADGHMLLNIERNNVSGGGTPGRVVRIASRELLDHSDPNWHSAPKRPIVTDYTFDPNTPRQFHVTPPNDGTGYVDIMYSKRPTELATTASNIEVDDLYQTALLDYLLYRCYTKDSDFAAGQQLASLYWGAFSTAIGTNEQGKLAENPNLAMTPPDMSNRASAK